MPKLPIPAPIRLDPPGPHVTPTAEGFLGPTIVLARGQVQLRFVLENEVELHLPISEHALSKLCADLAAFQRAQWKRL
jgi:hypothetical protein